MNYTLQEWLNLTFRWIHIFAAILWVGATYYFTWLDRRFHTTDPDEVWMVHSGGFYVVGKETKPSPDHTLHWFRWEAAITFMSGVPLLILVYYMGGALVAGEQSFRMALLVGIGTLVLGGMAYDILWDSPIGRNEPLAIAISFAAIVGLAWWLPQVMAPRAAFLHIGAMMGTIMAVNVWAHIIPAQRKMVKAVQEGREPDERLAHRAKFRSKHNTYLVIPVVFMMISNHYPIATYGSRYNWIVLSVLTLLGWGVAHVVRKH
jgi:uncharacterized membrane protein